MSDLTVKVLEEIRGMRDEQRATNDRIVTMQETMNARFEIVETTLRDLAQQLVMLARGVKAAIEARAANDATLDDHERRIADLERRIS